jgi:septal ring factor EnvC (AmiA/AmiB activator)
MIEKPSNLTDAWKRIRELEAENKNLLTHQNWLENQTVGTSIAEDQKEIDELKHQVTVLESTLAMKEYEIRRLRTYKGVD